MGGLQNFFDPNGDKAMQRARRALLEDIRDQGGTPTAAHREAMRRLDLDGLLDVQPFLETGHMRPASEHDNDDDLRPGETGRDLRMLDAPGRPSGPLTAVDPGPIAPAPAPDGDESET